MINFKKEKLIKKHLGIATPDWIVQNCIKMLNEFEDIALTIPVVSQQSELLPDFLYKDDFGIKIGYHGDTEVSEEWNDYLKKSGNCG